MKYLFVFEDGISGQTDNKPTAADLQMVDEGVLDIYMYEDEVFKCYPSRDHVEELLYEESNDGDYHAL